MTYLVGYTHGCMSIKLDDSSTPDIAAEGLVRLDTPAKAYIRNFPLNRT